MHGGIYRHADVQKCQSVSDLTLREHSLRFFRRIGCAKPHMRKMYAIVPIASKSHALPDQHSLTHMGVTPAVNQSTPPLCCSQGPSTIGKHIRTILQRHRTRFQRLDRGLQLQTRPWTEDVPSQHQPAADGQLNCQPVGCSSVWPVQYIKSKHILYVLCCPDEVSASLAPSCGGPLCHVCCC